MPWLMISQGFFIYSPFGYEKIPFTESTKLIGVNDRKVS